MHQTREAINLLLESTAQTQLWAALRSTSLETTTRVLVFMDSGNT